MSEKLSGAKLAFLIAALGLLLLILVGIFTHFGIAAPQGQASSTVETLYPGPGAPVPRLSLVSTTIVPPEVEMLNRDKEKLKGKNLRDEMRSSLETKVASDSKIATQRAEAMKYTGVPPTPMIRHLPTATLTTGYYEGAQQDFHIWEAIIKNAWSQYVDNNEYIVVYAGELGSDTDDPGRGVVYALRETGDRRIKSFNRYLLPEGTGWVQVSDIKGDYLILTSKEGKTFYFYMPGQQFVSSLKDIAPTVTPLPTARPFLPNGLLPTLAPTPYPYPVP